MHNEESKDGDLLNKVGERFKDCGEKKSYTHNSWSGSVVINGQKSAEKLQWSLAKKNAVFICLSWSELLYNTSRHKKKKNFSQKMIFLRHLISY